MNFIVLYNTLSKRYVIRSYHFWESDLKFKEKYIPIFKTPNLYVAYKVRDELHKVEGKL